MSSKKSPVSSSHATKREPSLVAAAVCNLPLGLGSGTGPLSIDQPLSVSRARVQLPPS
jgi:hypothetical protein